MSIHYYNSMHLITMVNVVIQNSQRNTKTTFPGFMLNKQYLVENNTTRTAIVRRFCLVSTKWIGAMETTKFAFDFEHMLNQLIRFNCIINIILLLFN